MPTADSRILEISISVYDTTLPYIGDDGILDFAEKGSIHWIYDGGDNKFLTMMPSRLEFDMEVSIEESLNVLVYDYLFTGNETRYAVVMRDQEERVLWRGFLIPEEYVEPYDKATFFIHFTATDGLGRLKGQNLPSSFYRARQSIIKSIADCLKKTGLELEIWMDGSIQNTLAVDVWEHIFIDAQALTEEDEPVDCYTILEGILNEIGATLFQQNDRWYVMPWNRRGSSDGFSLRKYTKDGIAIGYETVSTPPKPLNWYATPSLSIKPPFKQVSVKENLPDTINLFPEKLISQPWVMLEDGQTAPSVKYWKQVGLGTLRLFDPNSDFKDWDGEPFEQDADVGYMITDPDIPPLASWPTAVTNYITLYRDIYIPGGQYIDFDFSWDFRMENPGNTNVDTYINEGNWYEITLDGATIISNRNLFPARNNYLWSSNGSITWSDGWTRGILTVKVRRFYLAAGGMMNIKFYAINTSPSPPRVDIRFKNLSFTYRQDIDSLFIKRRVIDFTNSTASTLMNGACVFDDLETSLIYQPAISGLVEVSFSISDYENGVARIWQSVYSQLIAHEESIYVQRENSDFVEFMYQNIFTGVFTRYVQPVFQDGYTLRGADKLFYHPTIVGPPQNAALHEAREKWEKTRYSNGPGRLGNALAELHHDLYPADVLVMEGISKGLLFPADLLQFELKGTLRNFIPVRIDITPNENQTSCTLIEYKNNKITDYGG